MLKRFSSPLSLRRQRTTNQLAALSSSPSFIAPSRATARRRYQMQERDLDQCYRAPELLEVLGFVPSAAPSKAELASAFRRELAKLQAARQAPGVAEQTDDPDSEGGGGGMHVLEPRTEVNRTLAALLNSRDARSELRLQRDAASCATALPADPATIDRDALAQLIDRRTADLISAYRALANSRYAYLYDAQADPSSTIQLGYKRSDSAFANYDARRQEFFFAKSEAKPLADFGTAYDKAIDATERDRERALAAGFDSSAPVRGETISFVLELDFIDAFLGCERRIAFERRAACRICKGTGCRRERCGRCPQCRGRGQLQLPSGSFAVTKACTLCNGSGSTMPPDCGACKGTGLGQMARHQCGVGIAPGACDGEQLMLRGVGHAGARGGGAGNVCVTLVVRPHRYFNRDGSDLHVIVPVQLSVVLGGGTVAVPVLDDGGASAFTAVHVAPSTRDGMLLTDRVILVQGFGMKIFDDSVVTGAATASAEYDDDSQPSQPQPPPNPHASLRRGNLYVHCVGVTPTKSELTKRQREALLDGFGDLKCSSATDGDVDETEAEALGVSSSTAYADENAVPATVSETAFAKAKSLCRHWLPG